MTFFSSVLVPGRPRDKLGATPKAFVHRFPTPESHGHGQPSCIDTKDPSASKGPWHQAEIAQTSAMDV